MFSISVEVVLAIAIVCYTVYRIAKMKYRKRK